MAPFEAPPSPAATPVNFLPGAGAGASEEDAPHAARLTTSAPSR
ncbi:MAG: hypothetical protein JWP66_716 [Naasia sp.]|nr:hypothetical protein [Naasia sp.]